MLKIPLFSLVCVCRQQPIVTKEIVGRTPTSSGSNQQTSSIIVVTAAMTQSTATPTIVSSMPTNRSIGRGFIRFSRMPSIFPAFQIQNHRNSIISLRISVTSGAQHSASVSLATLSNVTGLATIKYSRNPQNY